MSYAHFCTYGEYCFSFSALPTIIPALYSLYFIMNATS
nr:MAG TPA: hypothetical protein [Bacteriophage sp.]